MIEPGETLTIEEVAKCACVSSRTIRRWIARGILPSYRMGPPGTGRLLFRRSDVIAVCQQEIPALAERFWASVAIGKADECWEWQDKHLTPKGYGVINIDGRQVGTHRIAWILTFGMISSPRLCVCHKCDNPGCCNPDHLWLGTHRENMLDAQVKGRFRNSRTPSIASTPKNNLAK